VYVWQILFVLFLSRLLAVLDVKGFRLPTDDIEVKQAPFAKYIHFYLLMMVTNGPETCRGVVTQYGEDK
jgi:hypothetical protein